MLRSYLIDYIKVSNDIERLPAVWRMFHSTVGELHYLQQLATTLYDVIHDAVERSMADGQNEQSSDDFGLSVIQIDGFLQGFATKARDIMQRKVQPVSDWMAANYMDAIRELHTPASEPDGEPTLHVDELLAEKVERLGGTLHERVVLLFFLGVCANFIDLCRF